MGLFVALCGVSWLLMHAASQWGRARTEIEHDEEKTWNEWGHPGLGFGRKGVFQRFREFHSLWGLVANGGGS